MLLNKETHAPVQITAIFRQNGDDLCLDCLYFHFVDSMHHHNDVPYGASYLVGAQTYINVELCCVPF